MGDYLGEIELVAVVMVVVDVVHGEVRGIFRVPLAFAGDLHHVVVGTTQRHRRY